MSNPFKPGDKVTPTYGTGKPYEVVAVHGEATWVVRMPDMNWPSTWSASDLQPYVDPQVAKLTELMRCCTGLTPKQAARFLVDHGVSVVDHP